MTRDQTPIRLRYSPFAQLHGRPDWQTSRSNWYEWKRRARWSGNDCAQAVPKSPQARGSWRRPEVWSCHFETFLFEASMRAECSSNNGESKTVVLITHAQRKSVDLVSWVSVSQLASRQRLVSILSSPAPCCLKDGYDWQRGCVCAGKHMASRTQEKQLEPAISSHHVHTERCLCILILL